MSSAVKHGSGLFMRTVRYFTGKVWRAQKALENEVFATPMLVREVPEPVLKLLSDLSKMHAVLAAITALNINGSDTMVIVIHKM